MVYLSHRRPDPSGRIDSAPVQTPITDGKRWAEKGYHFTPLAGFEGTFRVLSRKRYRGAEAELSPLDLAIGWGPLSDPVIYKPYRFRQRDRWYFWSAKGTLGQREIIAQTANLHCIPADPNVRRALLDIRKGDAIRLKGKLVQIEGADGWSWTSSLSRTDTGARSCEVLWIESLEDLGPRL